MPFYLSGETPDWHSLAHRTEFPGIKIFSSHTAEAIDATRKAVQIRRHDGTTVELSYEKLLIGTGARPVQPAIEGIDLSGVFPLHTMEDSFAVHQFLKDRQPRSAVIAGGGYLGLEMADALTHRGIHVTVVSRTESILATVHPSLGRRVEAEMERHGVSIYNSVQVSAIRSSGEQLTVSGSSDFAVTADLVLVAVVFVPIANSELQPGSQPAQRVR